MDAIDRSLITSLRRDPRASFRDLGTVVGLSSNATAERVRRLVEQRVVTFTAQVNQAAIGRRMAAFIDVRLKPGTTAEEFELCARAIDGVQSATLTTGRYDYTLRVACSDEGGLVTVIETLRESCGAEETYSRVVLRETVFE